jgi:uncharacterized protein (TIGR02145 family)
MKKYYQVMILAVPLLFLVYICSVSAASGIAAYYVGPREVYDAAILDGRAREIINTTSNTLFIPVRTLAEQQSFLNNLPVGVAIWNDCGDNFVDPRDSNIYPTVQIGNQCWMKKNMAYLPAVVPGATGSTATPYYYVAGYNGTDVSAAKAIPYYTTYGVLYNWPAALTACPASWHLPSDAEYKTLEMYLGMTQAQADATGYRGNDEGMKLITYNPGYNSSGFTALMAGYRSIQNGAFCNIGTLTDYWTSTADSTAAYWRHLELASVQVHRDSYNKGFGCSVRCLKN